MAVDRTTKGLLFAIALFLGILAWNTVPLSGSALLHDASAAMSSDELAITELIQRFAPITANENGVLFLHRDTGNIYLYEPALGTLRVYGVLTKASLKD